MSAKRHTSGSFAQPKQPKNVGKHGNNDNQIISGNFINHGNRGNVINRSMEVLLETACYFRPSLTTLEFCRHIS